MVKRKLTAWGYAKRITAEVTHHPANQGRPFRALARAVGWQAYKRVLRRPVDVAAYGVTIRCYPDSQSASNLFYFTPRYDHHEMQFLEAYLRPGDDVLDIGSNIGTYALFMASRTGPSGRVVAFEPDRVNAVRLRENIERNQLGGRIEVHEVAVSDAPGTVAFLTELDVSNGIAFGDQRSGSTIDVATARIDGLVEPSRDLAFAKLDVEGVELLAIRGARALIDAACPPVWLVETYTSQLAHFGATPDDVRALFDAAGYVRLRFSPATGDLEPCSSSIEGNVVFIHRSHRRVVEQRLATPTPLVWPLPSPSRGLDQSRGDPGGTNLRRPADQPGRTRTSVPSRRGRRPRRARGPALQGSRMRRRCTVGHERRGRRGGMGFVPPRHRSLVDLPDLVRVPREPT